MATYEVTIDVKGAPELRMLVTIEALDEFDASASALMVLRSRVLEFTAGGVRLLPAADAAAQALRKAAACIRNLSREDYVKLPIVMRQWAAETHPEDPPVPQRAAQLRHVLIAMNEIAEPDFDKLPHAMQDWYNEAVTAIEKGARF